MKKALIFLMLTQISLAQKQTINPYTLYSSNFTKLYEKFLQNYEKKDLFIENKPYYLSVPDAVVYKVPISLNFMKIFVFPANIVKVNTDTKDLKVKVDKNVLQIKALPTFTRGKILVILDDNRIKELVLFNSYLKNKCDVNLVVINQGKKAPVYKIIDKAIRENKDKVVVNNYLYHVKEGKDGKVLYRGKLYKVEREKVIDVCNLH